MLNIHSQEYVQLKHHPHKITERVATTENANISSYKTAWREIHIALSMPCVPQI